MPEMWKENCLLKENVMKESEKIKKAYKNCLALRWKRIKTIPYKDLDLCLYVVEKYIELIEEVER